MGASAGVLAMDSDPMAHRYDTCARRELREALEGIVGAAARLSGGGRGGR